MPASEYNKLQLQVLKRFRTNFEAGRRQGNADRAYVDVLNETGDRREAERIKAEILASPEHIPSSPIADGNYGMPQ